MRSIYFLSGFYAFNLTWNHADLFLLLAYLKKKKHLKILVQDTLLHMSFYNVVHARKLNHMDISLHVKQQHPLIQALRPEMRKKQSPFIQKKIFIGKRLAYLAIHIHNYLSHFLRSVVDAGRGRCGLQRIPKLVWGFKITARREEERTEALVNFQRLLHRRMGERRGLGFLTHYAV